MVDCASESIEATLELLANAPAQECIAAGEADFARGDVLDEQHVRALIGERHRAQPE
jgi:predicted transcriptional regulator